MSFFSKICCCSGSTILPNKEFNIILGEGKEYKPKNRKIRYGTSHERMTSPGREALREYILTPQANKRKARVVKKNGMYLRVKINRLEEEKKVAAQVKPKNRSSDN